MVLPPLKRGHDSVSVGDYSLCDWISYSFQVALPIKPDAVLGVDDRSIMSRVLRLIDPWESLAMFLRRNPVLIDWRGTLRN